MGKPHRSSRAPCSRPSAHLTNEEVRDEDEACGRDNSSSCRTDCRRLVSSVTSAQGPAVPKTPWGDPDLQGTFSSEAELSVPFERQAQYGDRRFLTDAEYAQRRAQADKQLASDNADFDLETADRANAGAVGSATSPPPHWLERGKVSRRTSLVIDPPDGRLPPLAQQRPGAGRGRGAGGGGTFAGLGAFGGTAIFNGPEDLSLWERCISRGMPGATFPTVYNANLRIVQGPGAVAITYEMIHDTRVIPIGSRRARRIGDSRIQRRLTRALGRQHARRRHDELQRQDELPRLARDAAHHRALHARGRRDQLRGDGGRSDGVDEAVDGGAHAGQAAGRYVVRVCVPRRQQLDAQHPERIARRGKSQIALRTNVGPVPSDRPVSAARHARTCPTSATYCAELATAFPSTV